MSAPRNPQSTPNAGRAGDLLIEKAVRLNRTRAPEGPFDHLGVRFYRNSPETGTLQLRTERLIGTACLTPAEMRELAARMVAVADELEGVRRAVVVAPVAGPPDHAAAGSAWDDPTLGPICKVADDAWQRMRAAMSRVARVRRPAALEAARAELREAEAAYRQADNARTVAADEWRARHTQTQGVDDGR